MPTRLVCTTGREPLGSSGSSTGERFAEDLTTLFPAFNVKALSANQVLQKLQYDWKGLHLSKASIVLAISQSGQTFPNRVIEALTLLTKHCLTL